MSQPPPVQGPAQLHPRHFFLRTWRAADQEAQGPRRPGQPYDSRPLIALCSGAVLLVLMEYFGSAYRFDELLSGGALQQLNGSELFGLAKFGYWAGWRVLGYLLVPALIVRLVFKQPLSDFGMRFTGLRDHLWVYATSVVVALLLVAAVSGDPQFLLYYPFYRQAGRSWLDLWAWELMYGAQFLGLEFFFRGFLLHACRPSMGSQAVFVVTLPYCLIHFGKPWPEAMAAIAAGVVLGTLALKTRSIWSGFLMHLTVALSMDLAALLQHGGLPSRLLP